MKLKTTLLIFLSLYLLISCEKDDPEPEDRGFAKGVFISCEGGFNANNGSVSWYDTDSAVMINYLFETINGRPAGDVVQSFSTAGDYGVIVANNSQKIEIVDLVTFESVHTITGFSYPRYFAYAGNNTGYLSNGSFGGQVYKINLEQGVVTDSVEVGMGPEQMVVSGNYLYVANSGGWAYDNTVSVIDTGTGQVAETIEVGDIPVALVEDGEDKIWVLCRGRVVYNETWTEIIEETDSRLVRIDPGELKVDKQVIIGQKGDGFNPSWLSINPQGNMLYFGESGGLFRMGTDEDSQPAEPFINQYFTGAAIDPVSGNIFAVGLTDFSSPGLLYIYSEDQLLSSEETGIAPGSIVFTE